jgi:tetratricopeptide (TPR) repeat protein
MDLKADQLDDAKDDAATALRLYPQNSAARLLYEQAEDAQKRIEPQLQALTREIKLNANGVELYLKRARLYSAQHRFREAIADCETSLQIDPTSFDAYSEMAWYELLNNRPRESIAAGERALEIKPVWPVNIRLAHAYLLDGQHSKAWDIYAIAKTVDRDGPQPLWQSILHDFRTLRRLGITCPGMGEIESMLVKP